MEYSDERDLDTLTLCVYPGGGKPDSAFLYEDDGATTAYQKGSFALTEFTQSISESNGREHLSIAIGPSEGWFPRKLTGRTYDVEIHGVARAPAVVRLNGNAVPEYSRVLRRGVPEYRFDQDLSRLALILPCTTDSAYSLSIEFPPPP
jgi:hypothetical protein